MTVSTLLSGLLAGVSLFTAFQAAEAKRASVYSGDVSKSQQHDLAADLDLAMHAEWEHAAGLEEEHQFQSISHELHEEDGAAWALEEGDKEQLDLALNFVNQRSDVEFKWQDAHHWTFGLVKLTASTPKGSLVLHMLHRHGLAPLLAANAGSKFDDFMLSKNATSKRHGVDALEFWVESAEEFEDVKQLREMLNKLSLNAVRNLHSFDHQWSVDTWTNKIPGETCNQNSPGDCILQAGQSREAYKFMERHGFTNKKERREVKAGMDKLLATVQGDPGFLNIYQNLLTPHHTGVQVYSIHHSMRNFTVYWEGGGRTAVPLEKGVYARGNLTEEKLEVLANRYFEEATFAHKTFMKENRLKVWTHEQVEFSEMYERYLKAT